MLLPTADIFSPQTAVAADPSAALVALSSNSVPIGSAPGAKKNSTFAETMELLLADLPQLAPSATSVPIETVNPPLTAAAASSDQAIVNLNLPLVQPQPTTTPMPDTPLDRPLGRNFQAIGVPALLTSGSAAASETPPNLAIVPQPGTRPPDPAAEAGAAFSAPITPAVFDGIEATPPSTASADAPFATKIKPELIAGNNVRSAADATPEKPTAADSFANPVVLISKSEAGAEQPAPLAKLEFSAKEDRRAQAVESAEQATHTLPASSVEHGSPSSSASANHSRPVQHAAGIADQIKDALLTHLDEQRVPGRTVIHVRLNPPELGQVRVHLITYDDQVTGRLVVQDEAVRAALESQMPELRQRLEQAGITLGRFEVAHDGRGQADARHERPAPFNGFAGAWRPPAAVPPANATATRRGLIDMLA